MTTEKDLEKANNIIDEWIKNYEPSTAPLRPMFAQALSQARQEEREACAKVADTHYHDVERTKDHWNSCREGDRCQSLIAQAIRNREKP